MVKERTLVAMVLVAFGGAVSAAPPVFERDVLPLFTTHCLKCHGGEQRKAGLDLRSRATILKGGTSGAAVVPGAAGKSPLFDMVKKAEMPPGKNPKLTAGQVALIQAWIDGGALAAAKETSASTVSEKERQFWSFKKPVKPAVPVVKNAAAVRTTIDAFVLAQLEKKGLSYSAEADRITLIRRATFDLWGLPPAPEEVNAFVADTRVDAYERLIDRLLASPHYGERWGRHWLDNAGYADTTGPDNDAPIIPVREGMWRYRDYVVRSFNNDKPFDRFLCEQLAGDEMDDWRSVPVLTPAMREHLIATGFLRTAVDNTREYELNRPFERYQVLHDTIENITSNLLGLTVGCARCHDHKYDPISQEDYYKLMACLKPSYDPEAWIQPQDRHQDDRTAEERARVERHNAGIDKQLVELNRKLEQARLPAQKRAVDAKWAVVPQPLHQDLRTALALETGKRDSVQKYLVDKLGPLLAAAPEDVTKALTVTEKANVDRLSKQIAALTAQRFVYGKIQAIWEQATPPTYVFRRGNHLTPGREVPAGYFAVLTEPGAPTEIPPAAPTAKSSGRRTAWTKWLTRPDHPLTARVFVNRVWQYHFGEGIVATPDNFGQLGARPTHAELLDWLATEFVHLEWKVKSLHKLMMMSSAYRQASYRNERGTPDPEAVDPSNQLLWRMRLRRLESESIRDAVLMVSGKLDASVGGPPIPIEPKTDGTVVVATQGLPTATAKWRRSLYLMARRNYNVTILNVFDQPVMAINCTRRINSAVPLQSLTMMNDAFLLEQADCFAQRVAAAAGEDQHRQVETAFRLAFARLPSATEKAESARLLEQVERRLLVEKTPAAQVKIRALAKLCHMLLCANEFLYVG